jgi:glycosyltransferase involved in cell wall biosynthesis
MIKDKLKRRLEWRFRKKHEKGRITIVSQFYPPDFAATGQLLDQLTDGLVKEGFRTLVLTGMPSYAFTTLDAERLEFRNGICIRRTEASRLWPKEIKGRAVNGLAFILRTVLRLLRRSRRSELVIYTTEPAYLPIVGWVICTLTRTPYILILYDIYPEVLTSLKILRPSSLPIRIWENLNMRTYAGANKIVVLSEPMKELVCSKYKIGSNRVTVIPSWSDPKKIKPIKKELNWFVAKHKLEKKFVVMYSGNMGRCHDLVTLVGAALALRHYEDIVFMLIGGGAQKGRIWALARDLELKNIAFEPYQEYNDVPFSLSAADISIVSLATGVDSVVAPSKLYGHLAAGTPVGVITGPKCYLKDLVEEIECGKWFNNGDSLNLANWIIVLKNNMHERFRLGENGRKYIKKNACPEVIISQYVNILENCKSWRGNE